MREALSFPTFPPVPSQPGIQCHVIQDTTEFMARHTEELAIAPRWDTVANLPAGVTPSVIEQMRAALKNGGTGYVP